MASKVSVHTHPLPALATIGWGVPSSGEGALYATVCSAAALEEFCSMLMLARFGAADALLGIVGSIHRDKYINDRHVRTCHRPSDQKSSGTCYAHAAAAVIHMALIRITSRMGGYPSIRKIRKRILKSFPETPDGQPTRRVLEKACEWYPPLQFCQVNEDGARQAILRRRPLLAGFHFSDKGWEAFDQHFTTSQTRNTALRIPQMAEYRSSPANGGHAVVLTKCDPHSLTFLNSWGDSWGNNGSFSIEDHTVLELDHKSMCFFDIYWLETDLKDVEKEAFDIKVNQMLKNKADTYPSLLQLGARCPCCRRTSPVADFTGSI
jgi:hypothetical protein